MIRTAFRPCTGVSVISVSSFLKGACALKSCLMIFYLVRQLQCLDFKVLIVPFHCLSSSLFRQFWHCTFIISLHIFLLSYRIYFFYQLPYFIVQFLFVLFYRPFPHKCTIKFSGRTKYQFWRMVNWYAIAYIQSVMFAARQTHRLTRQPNLAAEVIPIFVRRTFYLCSVHKILL